MKSRSKGLFNLKKMSTLKVGDIVIAPYGCKIWLTPGKEYEVTELWGISGNGFEILNDTGSISSCLLPSCSHSNFNDWIIKENSNN